MCLHFTSHCAKRRHINGGSSVCYTTCGKFATGKLQLSLFSLKLQYELTLNVSRSMSVYEACLAIVLHSLFQVQRNRCVIKLIIQWKVIACIYLLERVIKWVRLFLFISLSLCTKPCLLKCYIYFVYSQKCFFAEYILCFHRKLSLICKVRYL
jgi:hypothetical protein